jgi:hypothetical protein
MGKRTSLRAQGWEGENERAVKGTPLTRLLRSLRRKGRTKLGYRAFFLSRLPLISRFFYHRGLGPR